jgi:hypothetical protein
LAAVIVVFSTLAVDFVLRYVHDKPARAESAIRGDLTPRIKIMLAALAFSTTTLFIRYVPFPTSHHVRFN